MANTKVSFGKGSTYVKKEGQIFFETKEHKIYLDGEVYGEDYYKPAVEGGKTAEVGGLPANTDASTLENKSISEVLDMILYPEYAPQFTDAKFTLGGAATTSTAKIGSEVVKQDAVTTNGTPAKSEGKTTVEGGKLEVSWDGSSSFWSETNSKYTEFPATYTYTATGKFAEGTEPNVSSKGTPTQKTADNKTTLLANASNSSKIDANTYHIKAITKTASFTITVEAPIYGTKTSITNADEEIVNVKSNAFSNTEISLAGEDDTNKQTFKIPGKLSVIKQENPFKPGIFDVIDKSGWTETTETKSFGDGINLTYYVYTHNGTKIGPANYEITATTPTA